MADIAYGRYHEHGSVKQMGLEYLRLFICGPCDRLHRTMISFKNRQEAGQQLAKQIRDEEISADLVLAIPRGGLPVGQVIAEELNLPLNITVARQIIAPYNPDIVIGAVTNNGSSWLDNDLINELEIDEVYIEDGKRVESDRAATRLAQYREHVEEPEIAGKTVILADDGIATGAVVRACIEQMKAAGASAVIVATPVIAEETAMELQDEVDTLVALKQADDFRTTSQHYEEFRQLSDETVADYIKTANENNAIGGRQKQG